VGENGAEPLSWDELDQAVRSKLNPSSKIILVSRTIMSPTRMRAIEEFKAAYPNTTLVEYDENSSAGLLDANEASFGVRAVPNYSFDKAEVIVSFGADFLGTWISPVEYAKDYIKNRKIEDAHHAKMSHHIQIESGMSLTGSNADNRIQIRPSEQDAAVAALFSMLGGSGVNVSGLSESASAALRKVADKLGANAGKSLVVSGSNNPEVQKMVNAINQSLGNYGAPLSFSGSSNQRSGSDTALHSALQSLGNGGFDAAIILDGNPVFELPNGDQWAAGLKNLGMSISCGLSLNETAANCQYVAPVHHGLESWSDVEPKAGTYSLIQPTINPLFDTRQSSESLLRWAGSPSAALNADQPMYDYLKETWESGMFAGQSEYSTFRGFWDTILHDGVYESNEAGNEPAFANPNISSSRLQQPGSSEWEVDFYETVNMGVGQYANNPWLQEMPDPISRCVWGNYLQIPVGWDGKRHYETVNDLKDGDIVDITLGGRTERVTVVRQFGQTPGTVSLAQGYGRTAVSQVASGIGINVQPWCSVDDQGYRINRSENITISGKVDEEWKFPCVQHHHTFGVTGPDETKGGETINVDEKEVMTLNKGYQGGLTDRSILFNTNLANLEEYVHEVEHKRHHYQELNAKGLYPDFSYQYGEGHHWGLHVDMNACTGCGACTVACMAENNVPVVGRKEVSRHHEMTWLRIDRYYYGDVENPNVAYQPMMCQHCDNAPCENVCPVSATNHSSEGLNQMAYNRCIGTRYCANNCPYKVRRFNWLDYTTADTFPSNEPRVNGEDMPYGADDLTRMVLNPDVTVRARGVMEKCSFCVQRIQEGKLTAKKEGRALTDRDVRSACQTACPTGAITFGDINKKGGELDKKFQDPMNFIVLEEVNVAPSVRYTIKVNNRDSEIS
jgi:molybdopterin-containing oxidoreductase family iron-sulfur binding subunit